jgi:biotin synthase-like enzyme
MKIRESLGITLLENRLSELENHGAELCQMNIETKVSVFDNFKTKMK